LAQSASGYRVIQESYSNEEAESKDWRTEIAYYLKDPSQKVTHKLRYKAIKYVLLDGQLYHKTIDRILLKCLSQEEAIRMMSEVHEVLCGAHQFAHRMKWMIRRTIYFWPTMLEDCFEFYKSFQDC
jgi:hypothetical protein